MHAWHPKRNGNVASFSTRFLSTRLFVVGLLGCPCFDGRQRRRDDYKKRADLPRFAACEGRCSACSLEHSTYFCHLCVFLVPASSRNVELGSWKCGGVYVPAARAHRRSRQYRWCSGRWFNLLRQILTSDCLPLITKESLNSVSSCYFCFSDTIVSWIKI